MDILELLILPISVVLGMIHWKKDFKDDFFGGACTTFVFYPIIGIAICLGIKVIILFFIPMLLLIPLAVCFVYWNEIERYLNNKWR